MYEQAALAVRAEVDAALDAPALLRAARDDCGRVRPMCGRGRRVGITVRCLSVIAFCSCAAPQARQAELAALREKEEAQRDVEQIRRECARIGAELQLLESAGSARQEEMLLVETERNHLREQLMKAHVQLGDLEARYQQRLTELDSSGACARTHMCAHTHCAHSACPLCVLACCACCAHHNERRSGIDRTRHMPHADVRARMWSQGRSVQTLGTRRQRS